VHDAVRALLRRYPLIRGRHWIADRVLPQPSDLPEGALVTTRHGAVLRVHRDAMYQQLYLFGEYEPLHTRLYSLLVRPGDTAFDVGANFGWYTTLFAKLVGAAGRVHAFEPVPPILRLTRDALELNGLTDRVALNEVALGDRSGRFVVHTFAGLPHGHASASDLGRADAVPHECSVTTLDEHLATHRLARVDFVKIDVEGFELEVVRGGAATLARPDGPLVAFEVNHGCLRARGLAAGDVTGALRALGYTDLWAIGPRTTFAPVAAPLGDGIDRDYLAVKPADAERVRAAARRLRATVWS
jgi:FkbM family methyltransferase